MTKTVFIGLACAHAANAQNLPEVNVKFSYPAADSVRTLEGAENSGALDRRLDEALQQAREDEGLFQRVASALDGSFLAKRSHGSEELAQVLRDMGKVSGPTRPLQSSFLSSLIPTGIKQWLGSEATAAQDYTITLHPPEEDADAAAQYLNDLANVDSMGATAQTAQYTGAKQHLLNQEIATIRSLVAAKARHSFLKYNILSPISQGAWQASMPTEVHVNYDVPSSSSSFLKSDGMFSPASLFGDAVPNSSLQINLHAAEESADDLAASGESLARAEDAKMASANAVFIQQKKNILNAAIQGIDAMVAGALA